MTPEEFLTPEQEKRIVAAIKQAEKDTSGEIRVHLESKQKEKPSMPYVWEVFKTIGMEQTQQKNGILFYVDINHRNFTIIADSGINQVVPDDFWKNITSEIIRQFKAGQYTEGLVQGILNVGQKLKQFFPYQTDDVNELPDEISKH